MWYVGWWYYLELIPALSEPFNSSSHWNPVQVYEYDHQEKVSDRSSRWSKEINDALFGFLATPILPPFEAIQLSKSYHRTIAKVKNVQRRASAPESIVDQLQRPNQLGSKLKDAMDNQGCHMVWTQIPSIQGFGACYFHTWHWNLGTQLEKLSLEGFWEGYEDAYDVSHQSVYFNYLSYFVGQILRASTKLNALKLILDFKM